MIVPAPLQSMMPMTEMISARRVFRGMKKRVVEWSPRAPLYSDVAQWHEVAAAVSAGRASYEHVLRDLLGGRARRAVSFSFSFAPAFYYATSSGSSRLRHTGHIGTFELAPVERAITGGGAAPFLFFCADGTVLLDPRYFRGVASQFASTPYHATDLAQNSARVDDEILLVHGKIRASSVSRVNPNSYAQTFLPWQPIVKSIPQFEHLLVVPPLAEDAEPNLGLIASLY